MSSSKHFPWVSSLLRFLAFSLGETLILVGLAALAASNVKSPERGCLVAALAGGSLTLVAVAATASGADSCAAWGRGVLLAGILYLASITWLFPNEYSAAGLLPTTQLLAQFEPEVAQWSVGSPSFPESEYGLTVLPAPPSGYYRGGHMLCCILFALLAGRAAHQLRNGSST